MDAAIKLAAYGIGLASLLVFWAQISDGMAGCYSAVSDDGAPAPLEVGGAQKPDLTEEKPQVQPGSVRVKVLPAEKK